MAQLPALISKEVEVQGPKKIYLMVIMLESVAASVEVDTLLRIIISVINKIQRIYTCHFRWRVYRIIKQAPQRHFRKEFDRLYFFFSRSD